MNIFDILRWARQQTTGSARNKLVLLILAEHVDCSTHVCWPKREVIAEAAECSTDTVDRALSELAEAGLVERVERRPNGGPWVYRLCLPEAPSRQVGESPGAAADPTPQIADSGGRLRTGADTDSAAVRTPMNYQGTTKSKETTLTAPPSSAVEKFSADGVCFQLKPGWEQPVPYKAHAGHKLSPALAEWLENNIGGRPEKNLGALPQIEWLFNSMLGAFGTWDAATGMHIAIAIESIEYLFGEQVARDNAGILARAVKAKGPGAVLEGLLATCMSGSVGTGEWAGDPNSVGKYLMGCLRSDRASA